MPIGGFFNYPGLTTFPGFTLYPGLNPLPSTPLGTSATTFTLQGDAGILGLNVTDVSGVKWIVRSFSGWGSPHPSIQVAQKPRQLGAWAGLSYPQARYLSMQLMLIAPTAALLNQSLDNLYAMVDYNNTVLTVNEAGYSRSMVVRRSDEVLHTRVSSTVANVTFQVVAVDPRKLGTAVSSSTGLPFATGGLTIPFTVPFIINSTVLSGGVSLTNAGNTQGPVKLRIDGPCVGPVITHSGTGSPLVFSSSLSLGAGEWLTVDMVARTAMANDQSSRASYITSRGWFGFDPGVNTFSFAAFGYDPASRLTVTAAPAWN